MKAVVFEEHGGAEVLQHREIPVPEISPTEVLIRVTATALNYNDIWARTGVPGLVTVFPHISGSDVCGVVEAVGSAVQNVSVGDKVVESISISCGKCMYCLQGESLFCSDFKIWGFQTGPLDGGQAEYARLPATNVVPKPENLTDEEAASMPLVLGTAWRMLVTRANVRPGDFVLVWGAAGGLGCMAIQICKLFSARVIAVVSSDEKLKFVEDLGAEFVVHREKQRVLREVQKITNRRGVDIVFEHVGSASWETSMYTLKWGGTIVVCGATTGFNVPTDLRLLWNKQQNYLGSHSFTTAELVSALNFVQRGLIKPVVSQVLPLREIAKGHEMLERGEVLGKIVMAP